MYASSGRCQSLIRSVIDKSAQLITFIRDYTGDGTPGTLAGNKQRAENYRNARAIRAIRDGHVIIICNFVLIAALCGFLLGELCGQIITLSIARICCGARFNRARARARLLITAIARDAI